MMHKITTYITGMIIALGMVGLVGVTSSTVSAAVDCTLAANKTKPACAAKTGIDATGTEKSNCGDSGKEPCDVNSAITTVVNVLLFIIGAISVIMIILGGIRYVLSNGDSSQIKAAKDTILYAVIGLIVSLLAYVIVGFVIDQFN